MGLLTSIKGIFTKSSITDKDATPSAYPPTVIDWSKFQPAGPSDSRSPCPMINALCNHHILPHNGRKITKEMAVNAITRSLNLDAGTAALFASQAVNLNPDKTAHSFDLNHLNKHGVIEHDVSLAHDDAAFGDNHTFKPEIWAKTLETYEGAEITSFESLSKARYERVKACKKAHEEAGVPFQYGIKELILSYGESALVLGLLGDSTEGKVPIEYLRVLFEQARVPYNEGWRKSPRTISQVDMMYMITNLIKANHEKIDEAHTVEMGTVAAVDSAVRSMVPTMCSVM